jgi:photosystem II stability/assembly factor-like uncharacterized protein
MKKTYLFFILLIPFLVFSQFNNSAPWMTDKEKNRTSSKTSEKTIHQLQLSFNTYWQNHDKEKKGSGYKPFMRWVNHWSNNTDDKGYLISPKKMWEAMAQKKETKTNKSASVPTGNWQSIGPSTHANTGSWSSGQGRVGVVHIDPSNPNTIYVGSPSGGIWKSTDAGKNWLPLSDKLPQIGVSGIAVDPNNPNTIYIATGDKDASNTYSIGVLKSTDGGFNWNTTGLEFTDTRSLAGDLIIHPTNSQILWCATNDGLYKTSNGGTTWTITQHGVFAKGTVRLKPGNPNIVYAVSNNTFYRSTNSGDSFEATALGLPSNSGRLLLDVTPANSNYVYVLSAKTTGEFQGIYKSIDGGNRFEKTAETQDVFESNQYWYDLAFAVSSTNADELYTGCLNIWKSINGGSTLTKVNNWSSPRTASYTHADIHFLSFLNNQLYAGTDGGVYVSANGGTNFKSLTDGLQISQFYKIAVSKQSAGKMVGGLQDNGGYAYSNSQWKNYYGADGMDTAIDPNNSDKYYGFIQNGKTLYTSTNGGNSMSSSVDAPSGETGNWVTPLAINTAGELFSGFEKLYKLSGSSWKTVSTTSLGADGIELISIDPSNDNIMYVVNGATLYKSADRGNIFTKLYTANKGITSVCVHAKISTTIYLTTAGSTGKIMKSIDGGETFTSISSGLPDIGKNVIKHQGKNALNPLYLGTKLGVYYRDDSMSEWEPFDTDLPNVSVTDIEFNYIDAKIIAATYGRGVWQSDIVIEPSPYDIQLVAIQYPKTSINCGSIVPKITVKNIGKNPINTITINYQYNNIPLVYNWSGVLASLATENIELPEITSEKGVYSLDITTTVANDDNLDNNHATVPFYINNTGTLGVTNTFETSDSNLLTYTDGKTDSLWKNGVRTGDALSTGTNKVYTTSLSGNYPDKTKAYLISQCYNLTQISNPEIRFKTAFDLEPNWDIVYVEYSTDFGKNWKVLGKKETNWYNSDRTNASSGTENDCQNCPGAQWTGTDNTLKTYSYSLNNLATEANVVFRIVFWSDEASNQLGVVVDDFVINGITLKTSQAKSDQVLIHPNPSDAVFNIEMGSIEPILIEVYDVAGKVIYSRSDFKNLQSKVTLDLSTASSGIYFIKIDSENQSIAKRIIKK